MCAPPRSSYSPAQEEEEAEEEMGGIEDGPQDIEDEDEPPELEDDPLVLPVSEWGCSNCVVQG